MSLADMHTAKRRRIDQAASSLTKPFRSPLRVDVKTQPPAAEYHEETQQVQGAQLCHGPSVASSFDCDTAKLLTPASIRATTNSVKPSVMQRTNLSPNAHRKSATFKILQKQHTRLLGSISTLRSDLDITTQAITLEASNEDAQLELLISKWRSIAREAAEELFRIAKDQVDREGGFKTWQERAEKKRPPWEDDQPQHSSFAGNSIEEEQLDNEQKEQLQMLREEATKEKEVLGNLAETGRHGAEEERDDESFTMDMMLRQLNVDLDTLGYDVQDQQWLD